MTNPQIPAFIPTPRRIQAARYRSHLRKQQLLLRKQQRDDFFIFIYTCCLVAGLVLFALH